MARWKIPSESYLAALRIFHKARHDAHTLGMNDNGGAIHSLERLLDTLAHRICYPQLSHGNSAKDDPSIERSVGADIAFRAGDRRNILVEHVAPKRAFTASFCQEMDQGASDTELLVYIKDNFRIVLLDKEETKHLNSINRSEMSTDRLERAGIKIINPRAPQEAKPLSPT